MASQDEVSQDVVSDAAPISINSDLENKITDGSTDDNALAETSIGSVEFMCPFCSAKFSTEEEEDDHIASCENAESD